MKNIVITNLPDILMNVDDKFHYNFYNENEVLTNDSIINTTVDVPYKYISLNISSSTYYDARIFNLIDSVDFNSISELSKSELTTLELEYFNKSQDDTRISLNIDKSNDSIAKINNFFNIATLEHNDAIDFIKSNKKLKIENNVKEEFIKSNKNNIFFTSKEEQDLVDYNKFINTSSENVENIEELSLNKNYKIFNQTYTYLNSRIYYYINVGFLIEKYIFENNAYIKKNSKFVYNDRNIYSRRIDLISDRGRINIKFNSEIRDHSIKYGKTYKYVIYPVFLTQMPAKRNYILNDNFLVCGLPYFTNNILCEENKRPISPSILTFSYKEVKKELSINWNAPLEEQGDVKGYQIFKRNNLNEPFTLIKQLEFHSENDFYKRNENVSLEIVSRLRNHKTECIDKQFIPSRIQIYTICSIDAHGYTSNYSAQFGVKYDLQTKKCIIDLVSPAGAPLHMPNLLIPRKTKFFDNDDYIVSNVPVEEKLKKASIYVTPEYKLITGDSESQETVLDGKYNFSIYKMENGKSYIDTITIDNFI